LPDLVIEGIRLDSLVRTLCELGRVERLADLGENGPLLASAGEESLFHCLFGRDALRMAMDLLDDFPEVARATLVELARLQGVNADARSEEEPGRILHEFRAPDDPNAAVLCHSGWAFPYYGTVDATPQWVNLLGAYCQRYGTEILRSPVTNRAWQPITLRESLNCALEWVVERLEAPDGGGYLWVSRANPNGLVNQVWEDSYDAYYDADGVLFDPTHAYAPVAAQGYVYDALLFGAELLEDSPIELRFSPDWLHQRAERLREQLLADFWQADLRTFALALTFDNGRAGRPARVVGSGPGHLLASRLLDGEQAAPQRVALMQRLFEPDLLGGAGIRTKSTSAPRFSPGSYHNGSIWPMDCGIIADGLRRHAAAAAADDLEQRILVACVATQGFPEFVRGDIDGSISLNTRPLDTFADGQLRRLEQRPQHRQGWTATRVWRILRRRKLVALG
jgi:glycogen debranching enzyme